MCGIVGIVSIEDRPVFPEELRWMSASIAHRGPDEDGFYLTSGAGLGMRRLSIIDLKTGRQPICNEDGSIWTVFNGEIYNYRELRRMLKKKGHRFTTTTDTETIVHLYEEYGENCVEHMRGMFGFAVWDERRRRLLLARDRLGIKPMYWGEIAGRLAFASELKAILQLPEFECRVNWRSLNCLFTFLYTPPSMSIVEGIHKLEPGHVLTVSPGQSPRIQRYWDIHFEPNYRMREEQIRDELRALLAECVDMHLVSDVPLGAFLSGGLDSSSVVALMSRRTAGRVKTFSIGFPDEDYSELKYARTVAKQFGTDHHELVLEPNVLDVLEDLAWHLDEPFGDSSAIPTYMVSKLAAQHVKVVLSGDGGDELFAGYDKYAVEEREQRYQVVPYLVRKLLGGLGSMLPDGFKGRNFLRHISLEGAARYVDSTTLFRRDQRERLFLDGPLASLSIYDPVQERISVLKKSDGAWLSRLQEMDLKRYLPLDILTKVDRMSMAHSLEVRVPLLDHKLVEFAATIPSEFAMRRGVRKYIFKQAMTGILPNEIIHRRKQGFAIPLGRWFRGQLDHCVRELLLSEESKRRGILRASYIEHLLELHNSGRDLDMQLWTLISFEMWCRTFLDGRMQKRREGTYAREQQRVAVRRPVGLST